MPTTDLAKKKRVRTIVTMVAIEVAVVAAVSAAFYYSLPEYPRWHGKGDWEACAAVASISPEEAVRIVSREMGLSKMSSLGHRAVVTPRYINETGWIFVLTCTGRLTVGEQVYVRDPISVGPAYAWAVHVLVNQDGGTGCEPPASYVRWTTNDLFSMGSTTC